MEDESDDDDRRLTMMAVKAVDRRQSQGASL